MARLSAPLAVLLAGAALFGGLTQRPTLFLDISTRVDSNEFERRSAASPLIR